MTEQERALGAPAAGSPCPSCSALLQEAKDALMAFLYDPAEAARAREVLRQLDEKLLPLASRRMPQ